MRRRVILSIIMLNVLIIIHIFSGAVRGYTLNYIPEVDMYPPDSEEVMDRNNNTTSLNGLAGVGYFDSISGGVGDPYYGLNQNNNTVKWDLYIPDFYQYGTTSIRISPKYHAVRESYTGETVYLVVPNRHGLDSGTDYHNDFDINPTGWEVHLQKGYSYIYDADDFRSRTDTGPGCWETNKYLDLDKYEDGEWEGRDNIAHLVREKTTVCLVGQLAKNTATIYMYDQLNLECDEDWILESVSFRIAVHEDLYEYCEGHTAEVDFDMRHEDGWDSIRERHEEAEEDWEVTTVTPDEVFGTPDETSYDGFEYSYLWWDIDYAVNKRLNEVANSWDNNQPQFYYRLKMEASTGWLWDTARSNNYLSEFSCIYKLRWDGDGDFAKNQEFANILLRAKSDGGWIYPEITTGNIHFGMEWKHVTDSDLMIACGGGINIDDIAVEYDFEKSGWLELGSTVDDVILQFYDGNSWTTLTPTLGVWTINSSDISLEDYYTPGVGINFRFRAINFVTGVEGFAFIYEIDYYYIAYLKNVSTSEYSGSGDFQVSPNRGINEYWNTVVFLLTPYLTHARLGLIDLTLKVQPPIIYDDDGFPLYFMYDDTTIGINWYCTDAEFVQLFWDTDDGTPVISDYRINENATEQCAERFNITASDSESYLKEAWLLGEKEIKGHGIFNVKPNIDGLYQQWYQNGYERLVGQEYNYIQARNSLGYNDSFTNSSYGFENIIGDFNISEIQLNIFASTAGVIEVYDLEIDMYVNGSWLGSKSLHIGEEWWDWYNISWKGLNLQAEDCDDLEVNFKMGWMESSSFVFIDTAYCNLSYTGWVNESFTYNLTKRSISGPDVTFYDDIVFPSFGDYIYWYMIRDIAGNWLTTPRYNLTVVRAFVIIEIIQLIDYEENTIGNNLIFNISDTNASTYKVYIDKNLEYYETWESPESQINVSIDGYSLGVHNVSIWANNTLGRTRCLNTSFIVYRIPVFTKRPKNFETKFECTGIYYLEWILEDDNPDVYEIYRNTTLIDSGNWYNKTSINYTIKLCEIGQNVSYIYTFKAWDKHNVMVIDDSELLVLPKKPVISDRVIGYMYENMDVDTYWIVSDEYLSNYTVEYYDSIFGWVLYFQGYLKHNITVQYANITIDGDDFPILGGERNKTIIFKCTVYDKYSNFNYDAMNVTFMVNPPTLTHIEEGYYYSDDEEAELVWETTDDCLVRYWIIINTTGDAPFQEEDIYGLTEKTIILNLYDAELDEGWHLVTIYVLDCYGNIVIDIVRVENRGPEAGVQFNLSGTLAWAITIAVGIFALYSLTQSKPWERWSETRKAQVYTGIGITIAVLLIIFSVFGLFPVTFVKLPEFLAGIESALGGYGLLVLGLGIAGAVIGGIYAIWYFLRGRQG